MKNLYIFIVSFLLLSSCCEITEEIVLQKKEKGQLSGIAKLHIDAKESAMLIVFLLSNPNMNTGSNLPPIPSMDQLQKKLNALADSLNGASNGISAAQFDLDFQKGQFDFSAHFDSLEAWNAVLGNLQMDGYALDPFVSYAFKNNTFERTIHPKLKENLAASKANPNAQTAQVFQAFENARYVFSLQSYKNIEINAINANGFQKVADNKIANKISLFQAFKEPKILELKIIL